MTLLNEVLVLTSIVAGPLGYWLRSKKTYVPQSRAMPCPSGLSRAEQHVYDKANNPNYRGG